MKAGFVVDYEFIGFVFGLCGVLSAVTYAMWVLGKIFVGWRRDALAAKHEKIVIAILEKHLVNVHKEIAVIKEDMKLNSRANVKLSETFHSQLHQVLLAVAPRNKSENDSEGG